MLEKKYLEEQIALYQEQLGDVVKAGLNVLDFEVDCSLLSYQKHREHDIRDSAEYKSIFEVTSKNSRKINDNKIFLHEFS